MTYEYTEYKAPSMELFQECLWDRLEPMNLTDDQVRDVAIWSGHKFLGYSLSRSGEAWGLTKKQAESVVKRMERNVNDDTLTAAVLATAVPIPAEK
jgi:hypothetical protein